MTDPRTRPQAWTRDDGTPMIGMVPIIVPPDHRDPYPCIENPTNVYDRLQMAQREHWLKPTYITKQKLLVQELMKFIVKFPTGVASSRRLARLLRAKSLPGLPAENLVTTAKRNARKAKTESGKLRAEDKVNEASVAMQIHRVREEGLNPYYCNKLAEALLRRVT